MTDALAAIAADQALADLSLEPGVVDAQLAGSRQRAPLSPWHQRRMFGFGASDVPALLVGLGLREASTVPGHVAANAAIVRHNSEPYPRLVLEKAGVKQPLKAGRAASIGTAREPELLEAWRRTLTDADAIDPNSVTHASVVPRELQTAIRDVECPILAASLDGWCRDFVGDLMVVEAKCGHVEREGLPWWWRSQVMAQLACSGLRRGIVVLGQMWARGPNVHGPIVTWEVERNEAEIAEIRAAVRSGWRWVEAIKKAGE